MSCAATPKTRHTFTTGDVITLSILLKESDTRPKPVDVTAWSFTAGIYSDDTQTLKSISETETPLTSTMGDADWRAGWVAIEIAASESATLPRGNYKLKFRRTDDSGHSSTVWFPIFLENGGTPA